MTVLLAHFSTGMGLTMAICAVASFAAGVAWVRTRQTEPAASPIAAPA